MRIINRQFFTLNEGKFKDLVGRRVPGEFHHIYFENRNSGQLEMIDIRTQSQEFQVWAYGLEYFDSTSVLDAIASGGGRDHGYDPDLKYSWIECDEFGHNNPSMEGYYDSLEIQRMKSKKTED